MATTVGDLKKAIAGYMTRNTTDFVINSADLLLRAVNNAKNYAQRMLEFNLAYAALQVDSVTYQDGGDLTKAYPFGTTYDAQTNPYVPVRSVKKAFLFGDNGNGVAQGVFPIRMISRQSYVDRLQKRYEHMISRVQPAPQPQYDVIPMEFNFVQIGSKFYITSPTQIAGDTAPFSVAFDAIKWLADFTQDGDTSFLLDYAFDYLQFRAMFELNFFLKEDQRFPISKELLADVWNNVVQWNATVIMGNIDNVDLA